MNRSTWKATLALLVLLASSVGATPPVLVLQGGGTSSAGGKVRPLRAEAYPYGYFGAQPTHQWSRQFGYHDLYRQWTRR